LEDEGGVQGVGDPETVSRRDVFHAIYRPRPLVRIESQV